MSNTMTATVKTRSRCLSSPSEYRKLDHGQRDPGGPPRRRPPRCRPDGAANRPRVATRPTVADPAYRTASATPWMIIQLIVTERTRIVKQFSYADAELSQKTSVNKEDEHACAARERSERRLADDHDTGGGASPALPAGTITFELDRGFGRASAGEPDRMGRPERACPTCRTGFGGHDAPRRCGDRSDAIGGVRAFTGTWFRWPNGWEWSHSRPRERVIVFSAPDAETGNRPVRRGMITTVDPLGTIDILLDDGTEHSSDPDTEGQISHLSGGCRCSTPLSP